MTDSCPVCQGAGCAEVFTAPRPLPVFCNALLPSEAEATSAPRAPIRLLVCTTCSHVWNADFNEQAVAYDPGYENSLHFSGTFSAFAEHLARRLVDDHGLTGRSVVEIGSGKGDFLALLLGAGVGTATGYDPSYNGERDDALANSRVRVIPDVFPTDPGSLTADLVCARHVLEHVSRPPKLLGPLATAVGNTGTVLYAEVPDGGYLLRTTAVWDVIYEHPHHFTAPSMHRLLDDAGFGVIRLDTAFADQYLWAEGRAESPSTVPAPTDEVARLLALAESFARAAERLVLYWAEQLATYRIEGRSVALWGAGSKGVTFLNLVPGGETVDVVVDINPRKHARHLPGTGQEVIAPAELAAVAPDVVLVMNPVYEAEIAARLDDLGVVAEAVVVDSAAVAGSV